MVHVGWHLVQRRLKKNLLTTEILSFDFELHRCPLQQAHSSPVPLLLTETIGLIRASDLQQTCTFRLLSSFGYASASIISLYLTSINRLFINTYKSRNRTHNPLVVGSNPTGPIAERFTLKQLTTHFLSCLLSICLIQLTLY